ncbi:hypothetical protein M8J77_025006 [Diaphorina citri]|nr:hypothetical protein M8J77_022963 [Diaphorina citri]KAI5748395.1 hypothetical protein M8J77_025006 [Diaphorina citri]
MDEQRQQLEEKFHVPLLDGTNYDNWRFRLEVLLDEKDLLEFVQRDVSTMIQENKEANNSKVVQRDKYCKRLIISSISDSQLEYCKGKSSSFELWNSLASVFQRKGIASQLHVRKLLLSMKHNPSSETMEKHFLKFDKLVRDLKTAGGNIEEMDIICHLLLTMPVEYNMVVTAIETLSDKLTLSFVKGRLLDEETKRNCKSKNKMNESSVFHTQAVNHSSQRKSHSQYKGTSQSFPKSQSFAKPSKFQFKCHNCGGQGHMRSNCPTPKKKYHVHNSGQEGPSSQSAHSVQEVEHEQKYAFLSTTTMANNANSKCVVEWFLDSGATEHMVSETHNMHDVQDILPEIKIQVAKRGVTLKASKKGNMKLYSLQEGKKLEITINDVLYVPGLELNLLSVQKLEQLGFTIIFHDGKAVIKKGNSQIATAYLVNKLYKLTLSVNSPKPESAMLSEESQELWHRRLGHIGKSGLQKLSTMVDGLTEQIPKSVCEPCVEGKSTKLPHNETRKRATRPLELIHSDIFGPVTPDSYDGKRYVLTFIDDYTHFTAAYPIEKKSDAFHYFKIYEAMATAHFQSKITRFRCDRGGEYVSAALKSYFQEKGIQIEYTIAYTPEQNGVAERMNRSIVEKARCMLLSSGLSKVLWSEAVKAAVYIINRSPTSALSNSVPATLWFGNKANISKIKVFGSPAYLHTPKQLSTGKFNSKTRKLYLVGYCNNGYRLWCPINEEIIEGRDVIFDENYTIKDSKNYIDVDNENNHEVITDTEVPKESSNSRGESKEEESDCNVEVHSQPDLRRGTRQRKPPSYLNDFETQYDTEDESDHALLNTCEYALNIVSDVNVPITFDDVNSSEDRDKWMKAIDEELSAMHENDTWTITELPSGKKAIKSKWVFRVKPDAYGNIDKYKARLVIKGCSQKEGDYSETYAPVASLVTVRTLLSFINHHGLYAEQLDVKNAFLHGSIKEDIYMTLPDGLNDEHARKNSMVCKLNKTLYGLKQAPMEWNAKFDSYVKAKGFKQTLSDKCLYTNDSCGTILLLYVDDIIIAGSSKEILQNWKTVLMSEFKMTDLGPLHLFLGIKIDRTNEGMFLTQSQYIQNLLNRFEMGNCNPASTPIELNPIQELDGECILRTKPYRELIGCLSYLSLTTRPDISVAVNFYSRYQSNATDAQWVGLKRILRYLKGTIEVGMFYKLSKQPVATLIGYADADFAGKTTNDKKSTSGYLFEVFGNNVLWATRKQTAVAQSSTEAEYVSLGTAVMAMIWLRRLILELGAEIKDPIKIYEDNQSTIHCLKKWEDKRLRHVDTKYNLVKDMYRKGIIDVIYIPTNYQKADVLTKPLSGHKFRNLCTSLGLFNHK